MNLPSSLKKTAETNADKTAYIFMDQPVTYKELDTAVSKFADGLKKLGLKKGDHMALLLGNSPQFIIALYGAMRAGVTTIPVNPIYTPEEIRYILDNGDVKAVVALDLFAPYVDKIDARLPKVEHYIICETDPAKAGKYTHPKLKSFSQILAESSPSVDEVPLSEEDTAVILYTSGTTGKPKGAMLTHKNLYSNASDIGSYLKMSADDRVITALPMFHVFCLTVAVNAPLISGATLLILPKFSPKEVFRVASRYKATIFAGVPTMYNYLFQYEGGDPKDFATLRLCISGGASMPVALLKNFEKKFNVLISEGYGLSEASPVTCFNPLDRPRKPGSIGTNIVHVENKVVDELGNEVPVGEVGELVVRGPNVMKGYYKMPEETAAAIRNGWLHTGDMAKMDEEGYFYIVDRKKDMVIVGGFNVYPREVEEVLYDHPDVVEVAAVGIPDPNQGEAVKVYVVSKNKNLTEQELLDYCKERLAKYKVPKEIEFLEELPKNTTGKILRRSLKEQLQKQSARP
ncbi:fatty acid--CoA ligase family protein [Heyndrickxia coagulans]|uniref:fatty acid--CoA ligase family protein n=1 Tax=Heyndrickxia coagulans TaxID=1398 RepID=UPI002E237D55|nr:fatty acid--CoA ligase family protein [Heyndrickxia coagulans]